MKKVNLKNDYATTNLGKLIAHDIKKAEEDTIEIHLEGDLGTGKTFLTRSIISHCGWTGLVKSPTYTLCEEYSLDKLVFFHIDLYRSDEAEDIHIFDIDKNINQKKIIIIEWSQKLQQKRNYDLKINFEHVEQGRKVTIDYKNKTFEKLILKI